MKTASHAQAELKQLLNSTDLKADVTAFGYFYEHPYYIAYDARKGELWQESFSSIDKAIAWLEGKAQFTYEQYEGMRGQYVVLDPNGMDVLGEWVSLKEAREIVAKENIVLELLENDEVLDIAAVLGSVDGVPLDRENAQEWAQNQFTFATLNAVRKVRRKPAYFLLFNDELAKSFAAQSIEMRKANAKYKMEQAGVLYRIAYMLAPDEPFSTARIAQVWADVVRLNDADNLEAMVADEMWLSECITAVLMS